METLSAMDKLLLISFLLIYTASYDVHNVFGQICDVHCQRGIDQAYSYATEIHTKLTEVTDNLQTRMLKLESEERGVLAELNSIMRRMSQLESYLAGNTSTMRNKINDEVNSLWKDTSEAITNLGTNLMNRVHNITSQAHDTMAKKMENLEMGKIRNLTSDNIIWRRNFRVLNSTLQRFKASNCIC